MASPNVSVTRLTRDDFYDHLRCPRLVSVKAYLDKHPELRRRHEGRRPSERKPLGPMGEIALQEMFSGDADDLSDAQVGQRIEISLQDYVGCRIDEGTRELITELVENLRIVKASLDQAYGRLTIIGRGSCRMTTLPNEGRPDFVARAARGGKFVLVDSKNVERESPRDEFQGKWYNTMACQGILAVLEERREHGKPTLNPISLLETRMETLLIYPRLEVGYKKVTETIDLSPRIGKEIWQAKQLGFLGKWPEVDCEPKCAHTRAGIVLQDGNMEPAPPPSIIFLQGLLDHGTDLNVEYMSRYLRRIAADVSYMSWAYTEELPAAQRKRTRRDVARIIAEGTGIDERAVRKCIDPTPPANGSPLAADLAKEMRSDLHPWVKALGKERMRKMEASVLGITTRMFAAPKDSKRHARRALDEWGL